MKSELHRKQRAALAALPKEEKEIKKNTDTKQCQNQVGLYDKIMKAQHKLER